MQKKILVTGASGFIGSFLVEEAIRVGLEVYAGVRPSSSREFLQQPELSFINLNVSSEKDLVKTFSDFIDQHGAFNYVIHNAGITHAQSKQKFYEVNYIYTQNLVSALIKCGMPLEKFILISTLATYGPGDSTTFAPIQEEDKEKPLSTYARSKQKADRFVRSLENFPYLILKPTAVFGPRDKDFLRAFKLINSGFAVSIGRHQQLLSLIYVKDLARAVIGLTNTPFTRKTYLISDGKNYTAEELNETICKALKKNPLRIHVPLKLLQTVLKINEMVRGLWGRLPFLHSEKLSEIAASNWLCNSVPVWKDLNMNPQYDLPKAIEEALVWYREAGWLK